MIRDLVGVWRTGGVPGPQPLRAALPGDAVHHLGTGPVIVACTGERPPGDAPLCVVDGELYNARPLARELGLPRGSSPEAIVVAAYERHGDGMLERLRGEFAIVLWDAARRRGLLARDQLGARPLFLHHASGTLRFASEVRLLLRMLPARPAPDRLAVVHWLSNGYAADGRTLYEDVTRLPAGHVLPLREHAGAPRAYWEPGGGPELRLSVEEAADGARELISRAIASRLDGHERVGIELSGGLDSSSLAAIATTTGALGDRSLSAYSGVFPRHPLIDESGLIDDVVGALDLSSVRIAVRRPAALGAALRSMAAWELPPATANDFAWHPLRRRAAQDGVTVMLDGAGGDEVFGAPPYILADFLRTGRLRSAARLARRAPGFAQDPTPANLRRILRSYGLRGAVPHRLHLTASRARARRNGGNAPLWLTGENRRLYLATYDRWAWKRRSGPRWLAQRGYHLTALCDDLGAHDTLRRSHHLAGLEVRHPLMDVDLIDFMLRLPPELAWDPRYSRPVLREATSGVLPDAVRLRPGKSYFTGLMLEAMTDGDAHAVRGLLEDPAAEINAYVDPALVRSEVLERDPPAYPQGRGAWAFAAWRLATVECWLRAQADPGFLDRSADDLAVREPGYELSGAPDLFPS